MAWIGSTLHGSFRVGASGKNRERAIELFGKHDAGKFVGVGHRTERELLTDALAQRLRKAIGVSANKNNFARAAVALLCKPACQPVGVKRSASRRFSAASASRTSLISIGDERPIRFM